MSRGITQKVKFLVIYISAEIDDYFHTKINGEKYEVKSISLKKPEEYLQEIHWANAIFIQWNGRGQSAHDLFLKLANDKIFQHLHTPVYGVTTSNIRIEILSTKISHQLNISGWFDLPAQDSRFKSEIALLIPDEFDNFKLDIENANVPFLKNLTLSNSGGKHLVGYLKSEWTERYNRAKSSNRLKEDVLKSHVSFFYSDDAWAGEYSRFISELKFKYHDEFRNINDCMRRLRGQGSDMLVAFYNPELRDCDLLLKMQLETRSLKRMPIALVFLKEEDQLTFKTTNPDLFIDRFIQYDRNKDFFKLELIKAFESSIKDNSSRKLLDDLRQNSQDFGSDHAIPLKLNDVETICEKISLDPSKKYWADAERLLAYYRFKDSSKFLPCLSQFEFSHNHFDSLITVTAARAGFNQQESHAAARQLVQKLTSINDMNFDRLVRVGTLLSKLNLVDVLKTFLVLWWNAQDKFPLEHEFYWLASKWAKLSGFVALERALLVQALRQEPFRIEYLESYLNHLIATNHAKQVVDFSDYLVQNPFFPTKKASNILLNALIKDGHKLRAMAVLSEMIAKWPNDRNIAALKNKLD